MPVVTGQFSPIGGQTFRVYEGGWQGIKPPKAGGEPISNHEGH